MENTEQPSAHSMGHEKLDVHAPSIIKFAIGLAVVVALAMFLMAWMFRFLARRQPTYGPPPSPLVKGRQIPPGPLLEVNEGPALQRLLAGENEVLNSYGWVDKQNGVVRIPIDRAMKLLLQRGLPTRGENPETPHTKKEGQP